MNTTENTENLDKVAEIYSTYKDYMFSLTAKYVPDSADYEDVVQDALMRLIQNASALKKLDTARTITYISLTVRSAALDYRDKRKCQHKYVEDRPYEEVLIFNRLKDSANSVEESVLREEENEMVRQAIQKLPERLRMILISKYYLELEEEELITLLGYRKQSLHTLMRRAKQMLQKELEKGGLKYEKK